MGKSVRTPQEIEHFPPAIAEIPKIAYSKSPVDGTTHLEVSAFEIEDARKTWLDLAIRLKILDGEGFS